MAAIIGMFFQDGLTGAAYIAAIRGYQAPNSIAVLFADEDPLGVLLEVCTLHCPTSLGGQFILLHARAFA
eukprot:1551508-Amphidinium_carterae.1